MKQPRITDFDPHAAAPALGSPMDDLPAIQREASSIPPHPARVQHDPVRPVPPVPPGREVPPVPLVPLVHPVPPVPPVLPVRPGRDVPSPRRAIKQRHPFDIYVDQLDTLRQLALDERKQGGIGSMSAMVREAIDDYVAKRQAAAATDAGGVRPVRPGRPGRD